MRVYKFTILELIDNEITTHDTLYRGETRDQALHDLREEMFHHHPTPDVACILYKCSIGHRGAYNRNPRYEERVNSCYKYLQSFRK